MECGLGVDSVYMWIVVEVFIPVYLKGGVF